MVWGAVEVIKYSCFAAGRTEFIDIWIAAHRLYSFQKKIWSWGIGASMGL